MLSFATHRDVERVSPPGTLQQLPCQSPPSEDRQSVSSGASGLDARWANFVSIHMLCSWLSCCRWHHRVSPTKRLKTRALTGVLREVSEGGVEVREDFEISTYFMIPGTHDRRRQSSNGHLFDKRRKYRGFSVDKEASTAKDVNNRIGRNPFCTISCCHFYFVMWSSKNKAHTRFEKKRYPTSRRVLKTSERRYSARRPPPSSR